MFRKIDVFELTVQMRPHRFTIHKAGSLVWFQTFIQIYRISSNQKEGINSHLKDVHNDLFAPFLGGLFAGQSHCFLYYGLLLFICGLLSYDLKVT